jgi:translocation and assembly module TamB
MERSEPPAVLPRPQGVEPRAAPRRRRRRRRDWDAHVARAVCAVLALVGVLPFAAVLVVRSAWAKAWVTSQARKVLEAQGIVATYAPSLRVWPLALQLDRVQVESSDGGAPLIVCPHVALRPRIFALLAGKLAIDQIDLDAPRVRAVVRGGRLVNVALPDTGPPSPGPLHAPFNTFSVTDASLDLDADATRVTIRALDLDVSADDDRTRGSSFEVAVRAGQATVRRGRAEPGRQAVATDDDTLCSLEARVRYEPGAILVRRLEGVGSADLDPAAGTPPPCNLPADDKRRVELSLGHLHVALPTEAGQSPEIDGHVRVRAPIALAERAVALPETDGWVGIDLDVRYAHDTILPDLDGTIEAHDVRLGKYSFAHELRSDLSVRRNIVSSPRTTLRFAGGTVVLSDSVVDPLGKGGRLERTRLDATGVDFTALMRDLGVHPNSWVGWDLREVHAQGISGTFAPLKIDGDLTAKTYAFGVYDRPANDRARERLFGFSQAQIVSHFSVRPDALRFSDVHATLPHSRIDGAFVSIGFHNAVRVDVPNLVADLDDLSPIGTVPIRGLLQASARVTGMFDRPEPVGDITSATGLAVADVAFGDIGSGHVEVDVDRPMVQITGVRAKRRDSPYDVPTAKLDFGGAASLVVDAVGSSPGFGFRDILSMFALEDDPRFDGIDGALAARTDVHVALGGPEDACGGGVVDVATSGKLHNVSLYGEHFAQGAADVALRWRDRQRGIAGAEVDVRSFVLEKVQPPAGTRAGAVGTVLGSASIRRGGALTANVMLEGVPLSRIDALGDFKKQIEGNVSGVADISGNLDDFLPDAGFAARAELDVTSTRVRGVALANSHVEVGMTHRMPLEKRAIGHTRCGTSIPGPFDRQAYLTDASSHGEYTVDGSLFGDTIHLWDVAVTRAKAAHASGRVSLRGLDLGAFAAIGGTSGSRAAAPDAPAAPPIAGQLWGELIVEDLPLDAPAKAKARLLFGPTFASRGGDRLTLKPPQVPLLFADDGLTIPMLEFALEARGAEGGAGQEAAFRGGFVLEGGVSKVTTDPSLSLEARLQPIDLSVLQRLFPKVERSPGRLEGGVRVTGKWSAPVIEGELHARGDDLLVHGLPSALTDVRVDAKASSTAFTASGSAKFAGGTIEIDGALPIRGFDVGALDSRVAVRNASIAGVEGVRATCDADLEVTYDPSTQGGGARALPRLTGDITINSLVYTRPISMSANLTSFGKRAAVAAYDPALDFLTLGLRVRSRVPIVIKNNLVEVQLAVDSGTLDVTGTNQQIGLHGALRSLPGGRLHFQTSEFDVRQGLIRFEDATRISPNVDVTAVTEYRRYTTTAAAGAGSSGDGTSSSGSTLGGSLWRITLHAYGDADDVKIDMTSDPALSQEDIVLLLTAGMTRAELDQLSASGIGASIALNALGAVSGADRAVKQAVPIIDDFRFGSAYSTVTGKTEPQLTVGKRLTNDIRASVTAGLSEDREVRSNIEWRLNNRLSVQGSYDNINDISSSALGNLGMDLRWRLEFE